MTREESLRDKQVQWFAAGGGVSRMGPYTSQVEAWEALELVPELQEKTRHKHAADARVWPERGV